jgi:DNA-binding response OmpR family regulator
MIGESQTYARRVHLVVRDARLRAIITRVLSDGGWWVDAEANVRQLWSSIEGTSGVAVLDWTMADGLLTDEHRHDLSRLTRRIPLVVLVPEKWLRQMSAEDFGVAALVPKGWASEALLPTLEELISDGGRLHMLAPGGG